MLIDICIDFQTLLREITANSWFKITKNYWLKILKVRSLKWIFNTEFFLEVLEMNLVPCYSQFLEDIAYLGLWSLLPLQSLHHSIISFL
jgi:hypothetical protein